MLSAKSILGDKCHDNQASGRRRGSLWWGVAAWPNFGRTRTLAWRWSFSEDLPLQAHI